MPIVVGGQGLDPSADASPGHPGSGLPLPPHPASRHRLEITAADTARVHRYVARRVANPDDAADIAQQTLLQACAKIDACRGEGFVSWLLAIARNLIVEHYRTQYRSRFVDAGSPAELAPAQQPPRDSAEAICERRQLLGCVLNCITRRLRLEEQIAVLLADVYEYRDKESAMVLRLSLPSFKLLLHRARARLHEIAGGGCRLLNPLVVADCDECGIGRGSNGHASKPGGPGIGSPPATRSVVHLDVAHRRGAAARLDMAGLLALRSRMVRGLKLILLVVVQVSVSLAWSVRP